jgi:hypothetical protein
MKNILVPTGGPIGKNISVNHSVFLLISLSDREFPGLISCS